MSVSHLVIVLSLASVSLCQIMPGTAPSSPNPIVLECQREAGMENVTKEYPLYSYAQVIHTWCSIYDETLACIDRTLPDKKYETNDDWYFSLIYNSPMAKMTSDKVCASFPDVANDMKCLRSKMGNITRFIDVLVNMPLNRIPPLSMIIYELYRAKLYNNKNADNTACLAATHTAKVFHDNAQIACSKNVTNLITEYYMILNGKCDRVLAEKPEPLPAAPKKAAASENNETASITATDGNRTESLAPKPLTAAEMAAKVEQVLFKKVLKAIAGHPYLKHLERLGRDEKIKAKIRKVRRLKNLGLAKRMLGILQKMERKRRIARRRAMRKAMLAAAADNSTSADNSTATNESQGFDTISLNESSPADAAAESTSVNGTDTTASADTTSTSTSEADKPTTADTTSASKSDKPKSADTTTAST